MDNLYSFQRYAERDIAALLTAHRAAVARAEKAKDDAKQWERMYEGRQDELRKRDELEEELECANREARAEVERLEKRVVELEEECEYLERSYGGTK